MSALSIQVPFPVFQDRDGQPLENGYVWIGEPNLNPQTNPVVAYYDDALTIVAAQPLRTLNGYISRAGTPTQVYVDGLDFSILVQDSKGSMVYNFPEGNYLNAAGVVYDPAGIGAVATTVQAKLRESVSVKDFGAVGDGVANDTAALQAAMAAAGDVGFYVGNYNIPTTPTYSGPQILEVGNGGSVTGAGAGVLGLFNNSLPGRQLVQRNTTGADAATQYIRRIANHAGGTSGFVSSALSVRTDVTNAAATNFEWAIIGQIHNEATAGENVGIYGQGNKKSTGPTWGMVAEARDLTNLANPTTGLVGIEVDVFANGTDANANRLGVHVVSGKGVSGGANCSAAYAVLVSGNAGSSFNTALRIDSATFAGLAIGSAGTYGVKILPGAIVGVGVDLSEGTYSSSSLRLALRAAKVDLEPTGALQFDLSPSLNIVRFLNAGTERVGLDITGSPALRISATKVVGVQETGFAAFTGTTNKATTYATGTVTLVQLAERVASIQAALTTHGLIAA